MGQRFSIPRTQSLVHQSLPEITYPRSHFHSLHLNQHLKFIVLVQLARLIIPSDSGYLHELGLFRFLSKTISVSKQCRNMAFQSLNSLQLHFSQSFSPSFVISNLVNSQEISFTIDYLPLEFSTSSLNKACHLSINSCYFEWNFLNLFPNLKSLIIETNHNLIFDLPSGLESLEVNGLLPCSPLCDFTNLPNSIKSITLFRIKNVVGFDYLSNLHSLCLKNVAKIDVSNFSLFLKLKTLQIHQCLFTDLYLSNSQLESLTLVDLPFLEYLMVDSRIEILMLSHCPSLGKDFHFSNSKNVSSLFTSHLLMFNYFSNHFVKKLTLSDMIFDAFPSVPESTIVLNIQTCHVKQFDMISSIVELGIFESFIPFQELQLSFPNTLVINCNDELYETLLIYFPKEKLNVISSYLSLKI
ncbi:hypothetical protein P9112_000202 [Eukaryota sp. TZLM1-RC]